MNIINEYKYKQGRCPYSNWLLNLRDIRAKAKIMLTIDRMEIGLFGDVEAIGDGISELRIHYSKGYRIYFARTGLKIYLLLLGGDKSTQTKDIKLAKQYWNDYKGRTKHDN